MNELELKKKANDVRKGIVTAVHAAKAGHPGGSLSAADIMTYLYLRKTETVSYCQRDMLLPHFTRHLPTEDTSPLKNSRH